jgi:hypothetical protein
MILAALAIVVAGYFLWQGDFNKAFVIAAVGAVAWFLNYRLQMRAITAAADREEQNKRGEQENENAFDEDQNN